MDGADYEIEVGQNLIVEVELAVAENVALDAGKQSEAVEVFVQLSNGRDLGLQFWRVNAVRLDGALAVLCDSQILQPELLRGGRHFFQRVVAVARDSVTMKCAAQLFLLQ